MKLSNLKILRGSYVESWKKENKIQRQNQYRLQDNGHAANNEIRVDFLCLM